MLERLIRQYSEKGFQFAFRLCGNADEAKDLVQEAFLRVFQRWDRYDPSYPFDRYFLTVLHNIYCDILRRRHLKSVSLDAPAQNTEGPAILEEVLSDRAEDILDRLMRQETIETIGNCLREMSPEHRAILSLCDMEGLSYENIAVVLDCPLGTVRSRISRARAILREKLTSQLTEVRV